MMKRILTIAAVACLMFSCTHKQEDNQAELAGNAAKQYYSYLLAGDYDSFVDGTLREDSILRQEYRTQLLENARMFMALQQKEHHGIKSVSVKKVDLDSVKGTTANVFLILNYGDKGSEQVLMPMVKSDGLWYMK